MPFGNTPLTHKARQWCVKRHDETNHTYDGDISYGYHLAMVAHEVRQVAEEAFKYHLDVYYACERAVAGAWAHDVIEDARQSYNDVKKALGEDVADTAYRLTNNRGRTREERQGGDYYPMIAKCSIATLVKCCDRLANIKYSRRHGSRMLERYKSEHDKFMAALRDHANDSRVLHILDLMEEKLVAAFV